MGIVGDGCGWYLKLLLSLPSYRSSDTLHCDQKQTMLGWDNRNGKHFGYQQSPYIFIPMPLPTHPRCIQSTLLPIHSCPASNEERVRAWTWACFYSKSWFLLSNLDKAVAE